MATQPPSPSHTSPSPAASSKPSKFRFKSKRSRSASPIDPQSNARHSSSRNHRHHHHHHRSRHRPRRTPSPAPPPLSPNVAFRESLFDALADDEGAAFWEGVYGQPIHTYSPYASTGGGELERMDDEEYVAYVRAKMWEKSHECLVEERRRREEWRKRERKKEEEGKVWERGLEEALRRGEERKRRSRWKMCWEEYLKGWENSNTRFEGGNIRDRMHWPVESGKWKDVGKDEVERFFKNAPQPLKGEPEVNFGAVLKAERVRWHPDKVQQRFGSRGVDDETMKMVTAVFQVIDRIWSATRGN